MESSSQSGLWVRDEGVYPQRRDNLGHRCSTFSNGPYRWSSPIRQGLWWELGIATSKQAGSCTKQVVLIGNRLWVSMYRHNLISNLISNLYLILSCLVSRLVTLLHRLIYLSLPYPTHIVSSWLSSAFIQLLQVDVFKTKWKERLLAWRITGTGRWPLNSLLVTSCQSYQSIKLQHIRPTVVPNSLINTPTKS